MRLLNSITLRLSEFYHTRIPPYAILSHTWGNEEVTLQDMQRSDVQNKEGFSKILGCCEQAKLDGIKWVWIDTCCIDKTSSAELSEAINSMYAWYGNSQVCYAFLGDVSALNPFFPENEFKKALWFTRGWCLQELIAPRSVEFYAADWTEIGTKRSLYIQIEEITGIPAAFLLGKSDLASYTAGEKMSWASERRTTRQEDEAYCLLGIFGISMPLLYGEGRRAFKRLQEEIMQQTEDYSLLLWTKKHLEDSYQSGIFALCPASFTIPGPHASPDTFCNYKDVTSIFLDRDAAKDILLDFTRWKPPLITPRGLNLHAFVRKVQPQAKSTSLLLWTGCMYKQYFMCITLEQVAGSGFLKYGRRSEKNGDTDRISLISPGYFPSFELSDLYLNTDARIGNGIGPTIPSLRISDLEIILTTKCEENISFVTAFPPMPVENTGSCAQGQQLYSPHILRNEWLSLKFIVCQAEITTGHFIVNLALGKLHISCSLMADCEMDPAELDRVIEDERGMSDRATGQLRSGRMVYVRAKARNPLDFLKHVSFQEIPASYTLHVTLLGIGLSLAKAEGRLEKYGKNELDNIKEGASMDLSSLFVFGEEMDRGQDINIPFNYFPLHLQLRLLDVTKVPPPMIMSLPTHFVLKNGIKIPSIGFGISSSDTTRAAEEICEAIEIGYRQIDLAWKYNLDDALRLALQATTATREELFITTKFWPQFARDPALCLEKSLKKTGLDYVDLYLMHWPVAFVAAGNLSEALPGDELGKDGIEWLDFSGRKPLIDKEYSENLHLIWKKMEDIYRQGKARSLGVSNFSIKNLEKLLPHVSPDIPLVVNQIEAHPWFPNTELVEYCKNKNIQVQIFSPLGGRLREGRERLIEDPTVKMIAKKRGCAIGQLLQSWAVQRGTIPLGRSSNRERVASNFAIIRLSDEEIQGLDALDRGENGRTVNPDWGWDIFN